MPVIALVALIALAVGIATGYVWAMLATPKLISKMAPEQLANLTALVNRERRARADGTR